MPSHRSSTIYVTKLDRHILLIQPIYLQSHSKSEASFQVCSLIFVDKKKCSSTMEEHFFIVILIRFLPILDGVLGNLVP